MLKRPLLSSVSITKTMHGFKTFQNLANYQDAVAKLDFEYANRIREYNVSEAIFGAQSKLNEMALQQSIANENAKYEEAVRTMAFEQR